MFGVSIIVCCYNSSARLPQTVAHLCKLRISPEIEYEVIVIDNNSTDNTNSTAQNLLEKTSIPYKIVVETTLGLSNARKRGIAESSHSHIIFCDDDNALHQDYLINLKAIFTNNPEIGIVGGNNSYSGAVSNFVTQRYIGDYAIGCQSDSELTDLTNSKGFVWGAGMALRKAVIKSLEDVRFNSLLSDRKGKELSSGGDTELCFAARLVGWKIAASNLLKLEHTVPALRFNLDYLTKLKFGFGHSSPYLDLYDYAWKQKAGIHLPYSYKVELKISFKKLIHFKKALLFYVLGKKKQRQDYVELHFYLGQVKTLLFKGPELERLFKTLIQKYNV